jgi:transcriptional regulator with XRE-family HTH domain
LQEALVQKRKGRIFLETSGQIVSSVKEKYHLTQSQLAELLGVTQSYVSRVERGERKLTLVHLETLSKCLDLPMAVFLWRTLGPPRSVSPKKKQVFARMEALLRRAYPDSWE